MKEASELLPDRLMKPIVVWLHDDIANAMGDVGDRGMVHAADGALRPDLRETSAPRFSKAIHAT